MSSEPLRPDELHKRETDRLEARLWSNDEMPSLAGYRQLAFDAISLLKDSTYLRLLTDGAEPPEQFTEYGDRTPKGIGGRIAARREKP